MNIFSNTLAVLSQTISLAFLLLTLLTSPIFETIYLSSDPAYKYGIFGYCLKDHNDNDSNCSPASTNYHPADLDNVSDSNWTLSHKSRSSLSQLLIVSPVASFLSLVSLFFLILNCFKFYNRSKINWIFLVILLTISTLISILICVVVILLFYPNITWTAWLLIPTPVLNIVALIIVAIPFKLFNNGVDESDDNSNYFVNEDKEINFNHTLDSNLNYDRQFIPPTTTPTPTDFTKFYDNNNNSSYSNTVNEKDSYNNQQKQYQIEKSNSLSINNNSSTINEEEQEVSPIERNAELKLPQISNPYLADSNSNKSVDKPLDSHSQSATASSQTSSTPQTDSRLENSSMDQSNNPSNEVDNNSIHSDFTSVSQREINPRYYKGGPQKSVAPYQQQQQYPLPSQPPQNHFPLSTQYYPQHKQPLPSNVYQQHHQQLGPQQQYFYNRPQHSQPKSATADVLLNNNPDFMINQQLPSTSYIQTRPGVRKYGINQAKLLSQNNVPQHGGNGRSNYKNRVRTQFPPASFGNDGPYGNLN